MYYKYILRVTKYIMVNSIIVKKQVEKRKLKWQRYDLLVLLTRKKRASIKVYFSRNELDIMDNQAFLDYVKRFYIYNR